MHKRNGNAMILAFLVAGACLGSVPALSQPGIEKRYAVRVSRFLEDAWPGSGTDLRFTEIVNGKAGGNPAAAPGEAGQASGGQTGTMGDINHERRRPSGGGQRGGAYGSSDVVTRGTSQAPREQSRMFAVHLGQDLRGYLCIAEAPGKYEHFTYIAAFDIDLAIIQIRIIEYREDYGGEIGSSRWLRQFAGRQASEGLAIGKDIHGISGATISCRSLTRSVQALSDDLTRFRETGANRPGKH